MGPCDPRGRSNSTESNRTPQQDPGEASERTTTTTTTPRLEQTNNDPDEAEQEVNESAVAWEAMTAAGYTPLLDLDGTATAVFSDGEGRTIVTSDGGAFYSAFEHFQGEESDDEDSSDELETDFRSAADRALSALDDEYRRVVEGVGSTNASHAAWPTFQAIEPDSPSIAITTDLLPAEGDNDPVEQIATNDEKVDRLPNKEIPDIDTDAVTRAVQAISLRRPKLSSNMQEWEIQKLEETTRAPRLHPVIPSQPLAAFRKKTEKAIAATQNLSRSACIAESLVRLDMLRSQDTLIIHVVGCDGVECNSADSVKLYFGPVVRWIGAAAEAPAKVEFHLIGPSIPASITTQKIDLMPAVETRLLDAVAFCHASVYDDWLSANQEKSANLAIAFNAGVWGYNEWRSTVNTLLLRNSEIPFVFTAYTLPEAEDDAEVIQEEVQKMLTSTEGEMIPRCLWEAEMNPYASRKERTTHTGTKGRIYRENCAWQAWRL